MAIDDDLVADIAKEAHADERSVLRRLAGLHVRGRAGERIDAALAARQPERLGRIIARSLARIPRDGAEPASDDALGAAIEAEALAEAAATRARRHVDVILLTRGNADHSPVAVAADHMTRGEYARSRSVSQATVTRWLAEGMPSIPVGSNVRIDPITADEWRRARGRKPTKAAPRATHDDTDVVDIATRAGLRALDGGRRS